MLKIHSVPEGEKTSNRYKIKINGEVADAYDCRVSAIPFNRGWPGHQRTLDQTEEAAFVSFESDREVVLRVAVGKKFSEAIVRPISKNIKTRVESDEIIFTLSEFGGYTLELDGSHNALHIFFNPMRSFEEEYSGGRRVLRFAPGVHEIGNMHIESHTTVIVDGGAVLYGAISAYGAEDVYVVGYGIIDGSKIDREHECCFPLNYGGELPYEKEEFYAYCRDNGMQEPNGCVRFYRCRDVHCEGIIMRDSACFALISADCDGVVINNVKAIGMWRYNSDGIDLLNSENVLIEKCFLRNFDDCVVIKGVSGWDKRNIENIHVRACVVWCDWGRALEVGAETNASEFKNIIFEDCDLIHGSSIYMDVQHHNRAQISNVVFENIRAEYNRRQLPDVFQASEDMEYNGQENSVQPLLMSIMMFDMGLFSRDGLHGTAKDIVFKNITAYVEEGARLPGSHLQGLSETACVDGVLFDNIVIRGRRCVTAEDIGLSKNEFVYNVDVK